MTRTVGDYYLQIYRRAGQTPELVHLGALSHRDALSEFFAAISNVRSSKNPRQIKAQRVCLGRITEPRSICGTNTQIRSQASADWTDRPNTNFPELDTTTMYYDQDAQHRSTPGSYLGAFLQVAAPGRPMIMSDDERVDERELVPVRVPARREQQPIEPDRPDTRPVPRRWQV